TLGDEAEFGGLLGKAPIMAVSKFSSLDFIERGGRVPAPIPRLNFLILKAMNWRWNSSASFYKVKA
ncbi:hypothetical protein, partial [Clostridium thailandense]|uniref:hypothetical protein n=1 Tax=Clostridium thailandense TaxID=2794346 RepID=UPI001C462C09